MNNLQNFERRLKHLYGRLANAVDNRKPSEIKLIENEIEAVQEAYKQAIEEGEVQ